MNTTKNTAFAEAKTAQNTQKELKMNSNQLADSEAITDMLEMNYIEHVQHQVTNLARKTKIENYYNDWLSKDPTEKSVSFAVEKLPIFLKEYLAEVSKHTDALPALIVSSFLPYVACNIGNKVYVRAHGNKNFCRFWLMIIGPSSTSRKSTCLKMARHTMEPLLERIQKLPAEQKVKQQAIINNVTYAKMLDMLADNPNLVLELHEISVLFQDNKKNYNLGMHELLTALYDGNDASVHNMERNTYIKEPAFNIVGAITTQSFNDNIKGYIDTASGFLQRFILSVSGYDKPERDLENDGAVSDIAVLRDYDALFEPFRNIPGQYEIKLSAQHKCRLNEVLKAEIKKYRENDRLVETTTRIYNSVFYALTIMFTLVENQSELKMAIDAGETGAFFENLAVSEECFEQALALCDYYVRTAKPILNLIDGSVDLRIQRRVIKYLLKQECYYSDHSNLMRDLRFGAQQMRSVIDELKQKGFIEQEVMHNKGKKPKTCYRLVHPDD